MKPKLENLVNKFKTGVLACVAAVSLAGCAVANQYHKEQEPGKQDSQGYQLCSKDGEREKCFDPDGVKELRAAGIGPKTANANLDWADGSPSGWRIAISKNGGQCDPARISKFYKAVAGACESRPLFSQVDAVCGRNPYQKQGYEICWGRRNRK